MKKLFNFIFWPALAGFAFALALLSLPAARSYFPALENYLPMLAAPAPAAAAGPTASYSAAIRKAAPAVVSINSRQVVGRRETYDVNNPFLPPRYQIDQSNSLGSGVIISPDGFIITSYHIFVSPGSTPLQEESTVTLNDGRTLPARRLVLDEENDLALLKVDEENLPYVNIGAAGDLAVGDVVLAIGNPRNIGQSVSLGIISALLRRNESFVIQTDAAINPGNSGGALIDVRGNLIGINSTIISESGGSEGIGFATPAGEAISLMENYIESGPSGYLGLVIDMLLDQPSQTVYINLAEVRMGDKVERGILVTGVFKNGPAERAGIRCGDIWTAVDGRDIETEEDAIEATRYISSQRPNETVLVEVLRDGEYLQLPVRLGVGEPVLELQVNTSGCTQSGSSSQTGN